MDFPSVFVVLNALRLLLGISCNGQESSRLLFVDRRNVYMMDIETRNIMTICSGYTGIYYVDFHYDKNLIFWSDNTLQKFSRIRFPVQEGTFPEDIITGYWITGIAVDHVNDYLYWNDNGNGVIYRSNLDGNNITAILKDLKYPWEIELDLLNGWIYFTDNYARSMRRCKFNGSELETVVDAFSDVVYGITIDMERKIGIYAFFNERKGFCFSLTNATDPYDSELITDASLNTSQVFDLAVDSNNTFFTGYGDRNVYRKSNNNPLQKIEVLFKCQISSAGLKVFKPQGSDSVRCEEVLPSDNGLYPGCSHVPDVSVSIGITAGASCAAVGVIFICLFVVIRLRISIRTRAKEYESKTRKDIRLADEHVYEGMTDDHIYEEMVN